MEFNFAGYDVLDDGRTKLHFVSPNPGPGEASDYYLIITDEDIAKFDSKQSFIDFTQDRFNRKLKSDAILDQFIVKGEPGKLGNVDALVVTK